MAKVVFFEKPGCANNTRQKALLAAAGHEVDARNLLTEPWSAGALLSFFGARPVAEWFNRAAPRVKSGEIVPEAVDAATALAMMPQDPLLIRRPLLESGGRRETGFDQELIHTWLGLTPLEDDMERCPHSQRHAPCPTPR